ncbi:hypothetical protein HDU86_005402 [Geranomyces michiganensis]|nr:hypothetical protein HDU86_005402 [Geranomyces michiganensis]
MSGRRKPPAAKPATNASASENSADNAAALPPPLPAQTPTTITAAAAAAHRQLGSIGATAAAPHAAGRLGSLRAPRDLTGGASASAIAGATTAPKPKFAPTIPATRRKKVEPAPPVKNEGRRGDGDRGRGRGGRGRGRGSGMRHEVQMTASGPFAFGPAQRGIIQTPGRFSAPEANMGKTEYVGSGDRKGERGSASSSDEDDSFDVTDQWAPVSIGGPARVIRDKNARAKLKSERKTAAAAGARAARLAAEGRAADGTVRVKLEDGTFAPAAPGVPADGTAMDVDETPLADPGMDLSDAVDGRSTELGYHSLPSVFDTDDAPPLIFFQFPSVLPKFNTPPEDLEMLSTAPPPTAPTSTASTAAAGGASGRPQSARAAKAEAAKIKAEAEASNATPAPPAGPDGRVGQLLVYKSGKMQMRMGQIVFDVTLGPQPTYLQSVVAIDGLKGACHVLGNVSQRYVCTPDVEGMLAGGLGGIALSNRPR